MAGVLQHLRSSTLNKRPNPASMVDGQLAINYASGSPGAFFKDTNGNLVKVGPVHVGATAPNVSPASGGTAGNSLGEQWLDTSGGTYVFKIWDGAAWRSEAGEFVNVTGDTMTGAFGVVAGSDSTPGLFISGDANTGIYSPGADQLALTTNGTGRLFIDSSGRVGIGTTSPASKLDVSGDINYSGDIGTSGNGFIYSYGGGSLGDVRTGLKLDGQNKAFLVFTDALERARIDSSGRLLVGTSTADTANGTAPLQISTEGNTADSGIFIRNSSSVAFAAQLRLGSSRGTKASPSSVASGDTLTEIHGAGYDGSAWIRAASIGVVVDGTPGTSDMPGRIILSTTSDGASTPTERMRIGSTGRVTIQNNTGSYDAGGSGPGLEIFAGQEVGRYSYHFGAYVTGGAIGPYIRSAQNSNWASPVNLAILHNTGSSFWSNLLPATDNTYSCGGSAARWTAIWAVNGAIQTSDIRDKTEIRPIENGIDFIKRLRPITYKWKIGGYEIERDEDGAPIPDENGNPRQHPVPGNRTHWGFASQEVKTVADEFGIDFGGWVLTDKNDPDSQQALRYDQFIAPLTKALQEALAEIDVLKAKVAALESA